MALKHSAQAKYTTGSEEELADRSRTDIRLHNPRVEARIPIEIKIAGQWTPAQLRERLENQLAGQYMREARYGVFLVVNRGAERDRRQWKLGGRNVGFAELMAWLTLEADSLPTRTAQIDGLRVVGIDLLARQPNAEVQSARSKNSPRAKGPGTPETGIRARSQGPPLP